MAKGEPGADWYLWCSGSAGLAFVENCLDVRSRLGGASKGWEAQLVLRGHRVTQVRHIGSSCGPRETGWEQRLLEVKGHGEIGGVVGGTLEGLREERGFGFRSRKRDKISIGGKVRGRHCEWWAVKAGRENSEWRAALSGGGGYTQPDRRRSGEQAEESASLKEG